MPRKTLFTQPVMTATLLLGLWVIPNHPAHAQVQPSSTPPPQTAPAPAPALAIAQLPAAISPSTPEITPANAPISPAAAQANPTSALAAGPDAEALKLAAQMKQELGAIDVSVPPDIRQTALNLARAELAQLKITIDSPQLIIVVDRSVKVQRLMVVYARPNNAADNSWEVLGAVKVSTGQPGRAEHFKTPVGVVMNDGSIPGYRAQGTVNENGIRGIGAKGLRVYDFGWATTADWRHPGQVAVVRLEMHATDPVYLEPKLGTPTSEACIHIPTKFNVFIDHNGLLDADLAAKAATDPGIAWLFGPDHTQSPLAGDKLVVVDSSEPDAPLSNPQEAAQIEQNWNDYMKATSHS